MLWHDIVCLCMSMASNIGKASHQGLVVSLPIMLITSKLPFIVMGLIQIVVEIRKRIVYCGPFARYTT